MWLPNALYRKNVVIGPVPEKLTVGHPVELVLTTAIFDDGKLRSDHEDLEIAHLADDGTLTALERTVTRTNSAITVEFPLYEDAEKGTLTSSYYLFYGNEDLENAPARDPLEIVEWPVSYPHDGGKITYTRPGEHWEEGISTVAGARANLLTYATRLRITYGGKVGYGIAESSVDSGEPRQTNLNVEYSSATPDIYEVYEGLSPYVEHQLKVSNTGFSDSVEPLSVVEIRSVEVSLPAPSILGSEEFNVGAAA